MQAVADIRRARTRSAVKSLSGNTWYPLRSSANIAFVGAKATRNASRQTVQRLRAEPAAHASTGRSNASKPIYITSRQPSANLTVTEAIFLTVWWPARCANTAPAILRSAGSRELRSLAKKFAVMPRVSGSIVRCVQDQTIRSATGYIRGLVQGRPGRQLGAVARSAYRGGAGSKESICEMS